MFHIRVKCDENNSASTKGSINVWKNDELVFSNIHCSIGKNGYVLKKDKKEGDGKTPLGIYSVTAIFGYQEDGTILPAYVPFYLCTSDLIAVDDSNSKFYNQIIDRTKVDQDFNSYEEMLRPDDQYKYGFIIDYNHKNVPFKGSCIFFHIWKSENSPTEGCVATSEENMLKILKLMQEERHPTIEITI